MLITERDAICYKFYYFISSLPTWGIRSNNSNILSNNKLHNKFALYVMVTLTKHNMRLLKRCQYCQFHTETCAYCPCAWRTHYWYMLRSLMTAHLGLLLAACSTIHFLVIFVSVFFFLWVWSILSVVHLHPLDFSFSDLALGTSSLRGPLTLGSASDFANS